MFLKLFILPLKIISIPLIIIIGESDMDEKQKTIALLILAFLFNNLMGYAIWLSLLLLSVISGTPGFALYILIIGGIFFTYLITMNKYIKRKIDVNTTFYVSLNVVAMITGLFLL